MAITEQTRRESHEKIDKDKMYNMILAVLKKNQERGLTAREVSTVLYNQGLVISNERQVTHPRLTELVDKGIVRVIGKRKDEITNRNVAVYSL